MNWGKGKVHISMGMNLYISCGITESFKWHSFSCVETIADVISLFLLCTNKKINFIQQNFCDWTLLCLWVYLICLLKWNLLLKYKMDLQRFLCESTCLSSFTEKNLIVEIFLYSHASINPLLQKNICPTMACNMYIEETSTRRGIF